MDDTANRISRKEKTIAKFKSLRIVTSRDKTGRPFLDVSQGIFSRITRKRLMGLSGLSGRNRTKKDFWYDVRKQVKLALIDLQLFIEVAGKNNLNQVITRESLRPVVEALLWRPLVMDKYTHNEEIYRLVPDLNRAKIAQLLVEVGLSYLRGISLNTEFDIPSPLQKTIEDAVDTSKFLVLTVESLRKAAMKRNKEIAALAAEEPSNKSKNEG